MVNIENSMATNNVDINTTKESQTIEVNQEPNQSIGIEIAESNQDILIIQEDEPQDIEINTPTGGVGLRGYSAYEIAVQNGFVGTEEAWLESLKGEDGSTPYIVDGYWYIDGQNTNVKAEGVNGEKGDKGDRGDKGDKGDQGDKGDRGDKGDKGDQGEKGEGFSIAKTYPSISAMNEGYSNDGLPLNSFVLIDTGNVNDDDNAKLFVKLDSGYSYLTDLSGSQGIKGEKGDKGDRGDKGDQGDPGNKGDQGDKGDKGDQGEKGDDGVSATHSWVGTTLTITSASGTSSANLKGDKGDKGDAYNLTASDKIEIAELVASGGGTKIADLTNTTWTVLNGWQVDAGYGHYDIEATVETSSKFSPENVTTREITSLRLGYNAILAVANYILLDTTNYGNATIFKFTFKGGASCKDTSLIDWLYQYGEMEARELQPKIDYGLETESKEIVGAINEVNRKTLDKVFAMDTSLGDTEDLYVEEDGIYWSKQMAFSDGQDEIHRAYIGQIVPIVAGNNVEFEVDEENQVVKINAPNGIDKIYYMEQDARVDHVSTGIGLFWQVGGRMMDEDDNILAEYSCDQNAPIVAGNGIEFEVDEENKVVKINATGDSQELVTLDKVFAMDASLGDTEDLYSGEDGIYWSKQMAFYSDDDEIHRAYINQIFPIVAGENIEFELDENNGSPFLKINAKGNDDSLVGTWVFNDQLTLTSDIDVDVDFTGYDEYGVKREFNRLKIAVIMDDPYTVSDYSVCYYDSDGNAYVVCDTMDAVWYNDASRTIFITTQPSDKEFITWLKENATKQVEEPPYVKKIKVEFTGSGTVADLINSMIEAGYELGQFAIFEFSGANNGTYGLTINHYGGNVYNIGGTDFSTFYSMANNVTDWSTVNVWSFLGMFQPPIPYCDDSNNGQVLKVVNGVPTWTDL